MKKNFTLLVFFGISALYNAFIIVSSINGKDLSWLMLFFFIITFYIFFYAFFRLMSKGLK